MKGRDKRRRAKMKRADEPKATAVSRKGAKLAKETKNTRGVSDIAEAIQAAGRIEQAFVNSGLKNKEA